MRRVIVISLGLLLVLSNAPGLAAAESVPTFTKDVAPILFAKCVTCHRPGEVAPMSLLTYEQARPWARAIRQKLTAGEMPPWGADRQYGKFSNDPSVTGQEMETILAWVDGGAPKGSEADMPAAPPVASGWTFGEPEYVISMMAPYHVPPAGELPNLNFYSPIPFQEDRFARLLEIRPGNRSAVHHGTAGATDLPEGATLDSGGELIFADGVRENAVQIEQFQRSRRAFDNPETSQRRRERVRLTDYVPGRTAMPVSDPDVGQRMPAGMFVRWGMHYQPTGRPETDQTRLGIWFTDKSQVQELYRRQAGSPLPTAVDRTGFYRVEGLDLPHNGVVREELGWPKISPFAENYTVAGVTPIIEPITLYGFTPHMHLRGKDMTWSLTWPDGRQEVLLSVPKYDFNYQTYYQLEQPLQIPAGSTITNVAHYNNTPTNRYNPAPDKEVFWGEQSWDEMYCPFFVYTIDSEDLNPKKTQSEQQP